MAILLVLFSIQAMAATPGEFAKANFDSDVSLQLVPVEVPSGYFTLILADGTETYLLDKEANPITDKAKAAAVLTEDIYARAGYEQKISNMKQTMADFEKKRAVNESVCKQYTGTDNHPCTDSDTCKIACQSSPLCQSSFYNAPGYIDAAVSWHKNSRELTEKTASFASSIDNLKSGSQAAEAQLSSLSSIQDNIDAINSNMIFLRLIDEGGWEFCYKIDFSKEALAQVKSDLQSLKADLAALPKVDARSGALVNESQKQSSYISSRPAKLAALKSKTSSAISRLSSSYLITSRKIKLSGIEEKLDGLKEISGEMANLSLQGKYSKAFALEKTFDARALEIESSLAGPEKKLSDALAQAKTLKTKLSQATGAITGSQAQAELADMKLVLVQIESGLSKKSTPALIGENSVMLKTLDTQLTELIAKQTLEGNVVAQKPGQGQQQGAAIGGGSIVPGLPIGAVELAAGGAAIVLVLACAFYFLVMRKGQQSKIGKK